VTQHPEPSPGDRGSEDARAELVLSQALRAMAGGGKVPATPPGPGQTGGRRLTTSQLLLLGAIVGLLVGITAGLISLMF
jgi:hypothetical protein